MREVWQITSAPVRRPQRRDVNQSNVVVYADRGESVRVCVCVCVRVRVCV